MQGFVLVGSLVAIVMGLVFVAPGAPQEVASGVSPIARIAAG